MDNWIADAHADGRRFVVHVEIISRLCYPFHLAIWNGTKKRNTDTDTAA
jgi:hypothetical protein